MAEISTSGLEELLSVCRGDYPGLRREHFEDNRVRDFRDSLHIRQKLLEPARRNFRPRFAPVKTTPEGALPTYDFEKAVTIGKLVKADLTVTNASGELYGDDAP